jgi:catabolite regulation protein CreA
VSCAKTSAGKITPASISTSEGGEEVFEESRSLLFKTLRVQRVYDKETNTVVYVSFSTRLDKSEDANKSRFKSSICAVNLNDE